MGRGPNRSSGHETVESVGSAVSQGIVVLAQMSPKNAGPLIEFDNMRRRAVLY